MQNLSTDDGFSNPAVRILTSVASTAPGLPRQPRIEDSQVVRYLSGILSPEEAAHVESAAVYNSNLRRRIGELVEVLDGFQIAPFAELVVVNSPVETAGVPYTEWLTVIDQHLQTIGFGLRSEVPVTLNEIARMSNQSKEGFFAAKTLWRAMSKSRDTTQLGTPIQLGFGYRLSNRSPLDMMRILTSLDGEVHANGDLKITASTDLDRRDGMLFIAYSINQRLLPLVSTPLRGGMASVRLEGLGHFLGLPVGPVPANTLSATFDDWPPTCKVCSVLVDSAPGSELRIEMPIVRDAWLTISGYFESPRLDGEWELLLAITPNSWQMLAKFDIKSVIERPQVLMALMPKSAKNGPFGGALWLRRRNPR